MANSTSIEVRPEVHPTLRTTVLRIDDDLRVTIRQEEAGKEANDIQFNFTGLDEGEQLEGTRVEDPIAYVNVTKLEGDARCVIAVKAYHEENHPEQVPPAGIYWFPQKTEYWTYDGSVVQGKTRAHDPESSTAISYPVFVWNETDLRATSQGGQGPLPVGNTVASNYTAETRRLYEILGTTEERLAYLKRMLFTNHVGHPNFQLWLTGLGYRDVATLATGLPERLQNYWIWLESIARAISVGANVEDSTTPRPASAEQKFNLLAGDCALSGETVIANLHRRLMENVTRTPNRNDRSQWIFVRLGNVGGSSPFTYTAPSGTGNWGYTGSVVNTENRINIQSGITIPTNVDWVTWLRS